MIRAAETFVTRMPDAPVYDVAVLGAGAAGMAAALFAALEGRRVLLIERTEYLGGTSAYSAATTWVPNTLHRDLIGADDSFEKASAFLDRAVGNRSPKALRDAVLRRGPEAIAELEQRTQVNFRARPFHPDYLTELEGATTFGRALEPKPYEAASLGEDLELVRPPIPEFTILGGLMVDRDDIFHLLRMKKSLKSAVYALRLFAKYGWDKLRNGRCTRLLMGNALIGRMLASARDLKVDIATCARVIDILAPEGAVTGLVVEQGGQYRTVTVTGGVVLASGGFSRHPKKRGAFLPRPTPEYSPSASGHTGEAHDLAERLGAHYGEGHMQPCFWAPISIRKRGDGTTAVFPHFVFDRSKPGTVCVGRDGRRFVNESTSYHLFGAAQFAANKDSSHIPCFLVTDAKGLRKYGLGMIRPAGGRIAPYLADGYLTEGQTLADLAGKLGIDAQGLEETVRAMNSYAKSGKDPEFNRGETIYQRANGDAEYDGPNPTLGPIEQGPFYAVRLYPGDIGAAMGLVVDEHARVTRDDGSPIEGLYACGADAQSIMGGVYPGPGITIGPGIVMGHMAGKHAAARSTQRAAVRVA
jgi:succinate dehydrogenase/fumarate reductase flavoprotein subunit